MDFSPVQFTRDHVNGPLFCAHYCVTVLGRSALGTTAKDVLAPERALA